MGRSEQEIAKAVDVAIDVFRRDGYERTGIESLVEATGLNRYAIYQQFGGKRELFLAALTKDHSNMITDLLACMDCKTKTTMATMREFLQAPLNDLIKTPEFCGSLVCQAAFELAPRDELIAENVHELLQKKINAMTKVFELAQQDGSLREGIKPSDAAQLIMTTLYGLTALSQCPQGQSKLNDAMNSTFAILSSETA